MPLRKKIETFLLLVVFLGISFSSFSSFGTQVCGKCCQNQTLKAHRCCHDLNHNENCTRSSACQVLFLGLPEPLTRLNLDLIPDDFLEMEAFFKIRQEEPLLRPPIV